MKTTPNHQFEIRLIGDRGVATAFPCDSSEPVLLAARRAGVQMSNYCLQGACGVCSSQMLEGKAVYAREMGAGIEAPKAGMVVRPCSLLPQSDLLLEPLKPWTVAD